MLSLLKPRVRSTAAELRSHKPCCVAKKEKGKELGTEDPSSKRQQRVARRWAGGSQGYLSQKENGREKTILTGDAEAQGWGERQPCRDPGSDKTKCKSKSCTPGRSECSEQGKNRRGGVWRHSQGRSRTALWATVQEPVFTVGVMRAPEWDVHSFHHFLSTFYKPGPFQVLAESTTGAQVLGLETDVK